MQRRLVDRIPFAKIMVVLAVTFGIALGLCGVTVIFATSSRSSSGNFVGPLAVIELIAMLASAAGLVLTAIVWVIALIVSGSSNKNLAPPTIIEGEANASHQENDKN